MWASDTRGKSCLLKALGNSIFHCGPNANVYDSISNFSAGIHIWLIDTKSCVFVIMA